MVIRRRSIKVPLLLCCVSASVFGDDPPKIGRPLIIAHRGASGYLPEHTLPAVSLAYGMGADYIEQDVVLTKDAVPVVLHDIHIDTVTDVAARFPGRARADGRFYAVDFSLDELRKLRVRERVDVKTGHSVFAKRFPQMASRFQIATLAEEIELIQGLNKTTGRVVGIYPEVKNPAWHRAQGLDISQIVVTLLSDYGYRDKKDACYLQCFDSDEMKRIRWELGSKLKLVQLLGDESAALQTTAGIRQVATYADGIGPALSHVYQFDGNQRPESTNLVALAHESGLEVHPYTVRADSLPAGVASLEQLIKLLVQSKVDGLFTDFPDQCLEMVRARQ